MRDVEWSRTVAAVVNVPIFNGRRTEAHVADAQAQRDQLLIQQNDTERQVEQEVRQALLAYENARSRVELADQSLRAGAGRARPRERPLQGRRGLLDRGRQRADRARPRRATRIDAEADEAQARFDLSRATGGIRDLIPGGQAEPSNSDTIPKSIPKESQCHAQRPAVRGREPR